MGKTQAVKDGNIKVRFNLMNVVADESDGQSALKFYTDYENIISFKIPRELINDRKAVFKDKELGYSCIYFLIGVDNGKEKVYVGKAGLRNGGGSVMHRLREHIFVSQASYEYIWDRAIVFTCNNNLWGDTEINALERFFYWEIPSESRLNGCEPNGDKEAWEDLSPAIKQILFYLRYFKIKAFKEKEEQLKEKVTEKGLADLNLDEQKAWDLYKDPRFFKSVDLLEGQSRIPDITTPLFIVKNMLDLLPAEIWNPDTTFLDLACKGGEFLQEIYERLMVSESLQRKFPKTTARSMHILQNQIYGIGLSEASKSLTIDALDGYKDHVITITRYTDRVNGKRDKGNTPIVTKADGTEETIRDVIKEKFGKVKFDVVVGNPPYNKGMDIDFVNMGYELSKQFTCMITPAKWQTAEANQRISSQMSYGQFREKLVPHMSYVCYFPNSLDVFNNVYQIDGLTYYLIDKQKHDVCTVKNVCDQIFKGKGKINDIMSKYGGGQQEIVVRSLKNGESLLNIGAEIIESLGVYRRFNPDTYKRTLGVWTVWINNLIPGGQQVAVGGFLGVGKAYITQTQNRPDKNQIGAYFSSNSKEECESYLSYMQTKFVRFFLSCYYSKLTGVICEQCFRFVPAPPSGKFDHIYTDEELYKAFSLPQKYIDVIEAVVKERK